MLLSIVAIPRIVAQLPAALTAKTGMDLECKMGNRGEAGRFDCGMFDAPHPSHRRSKVFLLKPRYPEANGMREPLTLPSQDFHCDPCSPIQTRCDAANYRAATETAFGLR